MFEEELIVTWVEQEAEVLLRAEAGQLFLAQQLVRGGQVAGQVSSLQFKEGGGVKIL